MLKVENKHFKDDFSYVLIFQHFKQDNSSTSYPPTKGYSVREACKSQNINPIYLNPKFTFGIIQIITNAGQVCFSPKFNKRNTYYLTFRLL